VKVVLSWLREFVSLPEDPKQVADALDSLGLVVEALRRPETGMQSVEVARVEKIDPIEGADRIRQVTVTHGQGDPRQVVCGAWNFKEGDLVALALPGATLPNGMHIEARKMRGVRSEGMLCSAQELGLGSDASGLLILEGSLEPGTPLIEALSLAGEAVFDLEIPPNRPDALSVLGVARDLAAFFSVDLALPGEGGPRLARIHEGSDALVSIEDPELCQVLMAMKLIEVVVGPSPSWLQSRLTLAGMRPISNLVDVSNYVMLELGQPTHPYDLAKLPGAGLVARAARPGEEVVTLDGRTRRLGVTDGLDRLEANPKECVIAGTDGKAVGIAGVMGGASSEISESTTSVLFEAAWFDPLTVARTSKRLGLRSEASVRFERGLDPCGQERALARILALLEDVNAVAGGQEVGFAVAKAGEFQPTHVRVSPARIGGLLGIDIGPDRVQQLLEPLGFVIDHAVPNGSDGAREQLLQVAVPSWRPDVSIEADVAEEVARLWGYERIPRTTKRPPQVGKLTARQRERRSLRDICVCSGAYEAWTPSMLSPGDHSRAKIEGSEIEVANPLVAEESVLRRSLLPGILRALAQNASRRAWDLRLFELGRVFCAPENGASLPGEAEWLAVALAGEKDDAVSAARFAVSLADSVYLKDFDLISDPGLLAGQYESAGGKPWPGASFAALHPTRRALLVCGEKVLGVVGEVDLEVAEAFGVLDAKGHPRRVGWLEIGLDELEASPRRDVDGSAPSRFPSRDVDLAFVVAEQVPAWALGKLLSKGAGDLLEAIQLFDVYRGPRVPAGTRGLGFRLRLNAPDHTLSDEEVAQVRERLCASAQEQLGATLRS